MGNKRRMTRRSIWITLVCTCIWAVPLPAGQPQPTAKDLILGTWVLDLERSTFEPGPAPRSQTRTYETLGARVRATITTVDTDGHTVVARYTADYDSVDYPLTGSTQADTIRLNRVDDRTSEATLMHAGREVGTARRTISQDGRTMTITYEGTDSQTGLTVSYVTVHEKK